MNEVPEGVTIATVADLRRRTAEVMAWAKAGAVVVVQRDGEPQGVYMDVRRYQAMVSLLEWFEDRECAVVVEARKAAVDRGEMGTTSLSDMIAEFAPELQAGSNPVFDEVRD